jgi:hypothetical protein
VHDAFDRFAAERRRGRSQDGSQGGQSLGGGGGADAVSAFPDTPLLIVTNPYTPFINNPYVDLPETLPPGKQKAEKRAGPDARGNGNKP